MPVRYDDVQDGFYKENLNISGMLLCCILVLVLVFFL